MIRRAKTASLLARHTNQQEVWKFIIGSDKAGGVNYTHLTLETSLEPATAKTSLTIAGIYDTNDHFERRTKILNKMTRQFTKLHLVHRVSVNFEALSDTRLLTLKKVFSHKGDRFIEKQIVAKRQLETRRIPAPEIDLKFLPPKFVEIQQKDEFASITVTELEKKIQRKLIIGPISQIECLEVEVQNLEHLDKRTKLTLCPLCCRAFRTPQAAAKHVFLWHENFKTANEQKSKLKFQTNLKKQVDVRVTNLSRLLINEVTPSEIMEAVKEIVARRDDNSALPQKKLSKLEEQSRSNFHVSEACKHCVNSLDPQF